MKNTKYSLAADSWGEEEISAINDVIKSNKFTMGPKVKKFEEESKYSVFKRYKSIKILDTMWNGSLSRTYL